MAKKRVLVLGAALAASSVPALAHEQEMTTLRPSPEFKVTTGVTGLTADDLLVDRNGMSAIDIKVPDVILAGPGDARCPANNTGTCSGGG